MILEVVWTGKTKQNHCTFIKNQGFAKVSEIRFGVRFFIDFGVTLERFWQEVEALDRFLREKTSFKINEKSTSEPDLRDFGETLIFNESIMLLLDFSAPDDF